MTLIRTSFVALVAVAAMCFMSGSANAQGCGYGGGGYGGGGYGGGGVSLRIGSGYRGYGGGGYGGYYRRPYYHDTSHIDYNPGRQIRHGNHYDYVRGHKSLHRTGHWHR